MPFKSNAMEITRMQHLLFRWPCSAGLRYHINQLKHQESASMRGYIRRSIKTAEDGTLRRIVSCIDGER